MGLKDVDFDSVFRRLADKRIEDAMKEGKFDNLPGKGEPVTIDEAPTDENARALWWALRIMKQNDFIPEEVRLRKAIDTLKGELHRADEEAAVRGLCAKINQMVHKLNTMGTTRIDIAVSPVDVEAEVARVRGRQAGS